MKDKDFDNEEDRKIYEEYLEEKQRKRESGEEKEIRKAIIMICATLLITIAIIIIKCATIEYPPIERAADKPIIYLYPEEETQVTIKLGKPESLTCTYPKYEEESGWKVTAKPDGTLTYDKTGQELYSLYWEGKNNIDIDETEGFVIKGEESSKFLEEKLEKLGLTPRESEEFIVYWLPKLEANKYNFIRFETIEKINEEMPLEIEPQPDTVIRVLMEFKGLEEYKEVKEQKLETPERNGFVVVEWGGTELN
ncbi:MAG: hypothetical protein J6K45_01405 [Clostridia bacterium]|nr:hypothetical protein [Clostridia bacterium]